MQVNSGWANVAPNNGWDLFYYVTYAFYFIEIVGVVFSVKDTVADKVRENQIKTLLIATVLASVPGIAIDFVANAYLANPIPQMGSLFALFPVGIMYRAVIYHNMFDVQLSVKPETIITVSQQKKIFTFFSGTLFVVALITFFSEYFSVLSDHGRSIGDAFEKSALLFFLSVGFFLFKN